MPITGENETMGAAVRMHVTEQGGNPRQATLVAFGGPGHCTPATSRRSSASVGSWFRSGPACCPRSGCWSPRPPTTSCAPTRSRSRSSTRRRPGRSWRRWRIRSQRSPAPLPTCHARFAADSKSHQLDRELSALGPTTNLTTTTPILPQQRRSAGCFSCPLRTGRTIPFRGKFIGSSRLSSGLQSQAPVGLTSHGAQRHGHRRTRDDWCAGSEPEWQNHEIRMDLSRIDLRSRRPGSRAPASLRMHSFGRFLARRGRVTSIRRSSFSTQSCEVYFRREQEQY